MILQKYKNVVLRNVQSLGCFLNYDFTQLLKGGID
jgi:hypothetical protein